MEKPLFFGHSQGFLFGVLHLPDGEAPRQGILLCHAFVEEKLWSQRVYVNFAREAAQRGIAVFRFDFRGHGDSSGESEENSLERFSTDIDVAMARFREECPSISQIGILGLRFGGTLAALYAANNDFVTHVVLWEPVVNGEAYMQELLRKNLGTQLAVYGKVKKKREALVEEMMNGIHANVEGYLLSFDFYDECNRINLSGVVPSVAGAKMLVVQIAPNIEQKDREELLDLTHHNSSASFLKVEEPPFWREIKPYTSRTKELVRKTLDWWEQTID